MQNKTIRIKQKLQSNGGLRGYRTLALIVCTAGIDSDKQKMGLETQCFGPETKCSIGSI